MEDSKINISDCSALQASDMHEGNTPLSELKKTGASQEQFPPVIPSSFHSVLFQLPVTKGNVPKAYPVNPIDKWDDHHVKMPCSPKSIYPASEVELRSRWTLIKEVLSSPIHSSEELERAIFVYSSNNSKEVPFTALHTFCSKTLTKSESNHFFGSILPGIIKLALSLPEKVRAGVDLLKKHSNKSLSLSQEQVAVLLANAFLCTFPRRNGGYSSTYANINFSRLFQCCEEKRVQEKLKCFLNYFHRVLTKTPEGVVTFSRHFVPNEKLPVWNSSNATLPKLHINSNGTIEDEGHGLLEVDFANKFVGGGIIGRGTVQEEIKFMICPELVVSRLFTESLNDTEALIVIGSERYNNYSGYGETFTWTGNHLDQTERDVYGRKFSAVLAIDALSFHEPQRQYSIPCLKRELGKAFAGFSFGSSHWPVAVATGNWGCGVYRGDPELKALLQLMAASEAKRDIAYFTFWNVELRDRIRKMHKFLRRREVTTGYLWRILSTYQESLFQNKRSSLYNFIYNTCNAECEAIENLSKDTKSQPTSTVATDEELIMEVSELPDGAADEQIYAESYSIKTDEGRKRCILTEKERWDTYEASRRELMTSERRPSSSQVKKRLITEYFSKKS